MYDALDVVKGAISTKDLVPILTHVAIHQGRLCGYNGRIYINAPAPWLDKDLSLTVPASQFIPAIQGCTEDIEFEVEPDKLIIRAGRFRAVLPTQEFIAFPVIDPPEKRVRWKKEVKLLQILKLLCPFIGSDASRLWASGILFIGGKALATNNVVIAQTSIPVFLPHGMILPVQAIDELLRLKLEPQYVSFTQESATFFLPGDIWLKTSLIEGTWPPGALALVGELHQAARLIAIPQGLAPAIERVRPFVGDSKAPVVILGETVKTQSGPTYAQVDGFKGLQGAFRIEPLLAILKVATHADWDRFPRVPWKGDGVEGAIVGMMI